MPITDFLAREHPAFVHVPLGLVVCLPIMVAAAYRSRYPQTWRRMAFRVAFLALGLSILTMASGLFWARTLALVPPGGWMPAVTGAGQVIQRVLRNHEACAAAGWVLGAMALIVLRKSYHNPERWTWTTASLAVTLAWAGAWGYGGRIGGNLVFGDPETNKAAADARRTQRNDAEAEVPVRALDYASLEPLQARAFRSAAHGGLMARTWITASGIDAFRAGKPLPIGSYAAMSTQDAQGDPGPLYFRETKADGTQAFAYYWGRIPDAAKAAHGGEDSAYWRSPDPKVAACAGCHAR
jgi:hypothetical protein